MVLLWGYVTNAAFAAMDGGRGLETLLRADVLHLIGLSIVVLAWAGIRNGPDGSLSLARLGWAAAVLGGAVTLTCPWVSGAAAGMDGPARYVVGLVGDVPGVTRMPLVPLLGWMCVGVGAGLLMIRHRTATAGDAFATRAGAPARTLLLAGAGAIATATLAHAGTDAWVASSGEPLSRAHPAVWLNALDLGARGVIVLVAGALLSTRLPERVRRGMVQLGQGSLVAYVFHIPFCYGRLGGPFVSSLDMGSATVGVAALMAASFAAVVVRDGLRARARRPAPGRPTLAS